MAKPSWRGSCHGVSAILGLSSIPRRIHVTFLFILLCSLHVGPWVPDGVQSRGGWGITDKLVACSRLEVSWAFVALDTHELVSDAISTMS